MIKGVEVPESGGGRGDNGKENLGRAEEQEVGVTMWYWIIHSSKQAGTGLASGGVSCLRNWTVAGTLKRRVFHSMEEKEKGVAYSNIKLGHQGTSTLEKMGTQSEEDWGIFRLKMQKIWGLPKP